MGATEGLSVRHHTASSRLQEILDRTLSSFHTPTYPPTHTKQGSEAPDEVCTWHSSHYLSQVSLQGSLTFSARTRHVTIYMAPQLTSLRLFTLWLLSPWHPCVIGEPTSTAQPDSKREFTREALWIWLFVHASKIRIPAYDTVRQVAWCREPGLPEISMPEPFSSDCGQ